MDHDHEAKRCIDRRDEEHCGVRQAEWVQGVPDAANWDRI